MKHFVFVLIVMLLLFAGSAFAECSYFDTNGDHDWINGKREATCSEPGEEYRECSECGAYELKNVLETVAHTWQDGATEASCTAPGEKYRKCTVCGLKEVTESIVSAGHSWVEGRSEPTCTEAGESYRDCSVCGAHEVIEKISMLEHDWQENKLVREAACEEDGEKVVECAICGEQKTLILPATGHEYIEWEVTQEASCSREGERETTCYVCGKEITETIERALHDYGDWQISVEPTESSMGKRFRQCSECGATNEEMFYPEGTLYRGMRKNDDVLEMQQMLITLGILSDKADGIFGKNTEQAVKDFQAQAEFEVTGTAYPQTLYAIRLACEDFGADAAEANADEAGNMRCMFETGADGTVNIVYCSMHAGMIENTTDLFSEAEAAGAAVGQARYMWQNEMNRLNEEWLESAGEAEKPLIEASHAAFIEYMLAEEELLSAVYAEGSETPGMIAVEMLMERCAGICSMMEITD